MAPQTNQALGDPGWNLKASSLVVRRSKVEGDIREVQIKIDVIRGYVASAFKRTRNGKPPIPLTDINDTRVKPISTDSM